MTKFSITIDAPGLTEAIHHLANAIAGTGEAPMVSATPEAVEVPQTAKNTDAEAAPAVNDSPVVLQGPVDPAPAVPAPVTVQPKEYTLDAIASASAALIDTGKMQEVMTIIQGFGVPAINLLKPEQFASYAEQIRAIGGNI